MLGHKLKSTMSWKKYFVSKKRKKKTYYLRHLKLRVIHN